MSKVKMFLFVIFCAAICLSGCKQDAAIITSDQQRQREIADSLLTDSMMTMTMAQRLIPFIGWERMVSVQMLEYAIEKQEKNPVICTYGALAATVPVFEGARGETKEQFLRALSLVGLGSKINVFFANVEKKVEQQDSTFPLKLSKSMWIAENFPIEPSFIDACSTTFHMKVFAADLAKPEIIRAINNWVNISTYGKIDKLIEKVDANAVLYSLSATHFLCNWQKPFVPEKTKRGFHLSDGTEKNIDMMHVNGKFAYVKTEKFSAIELPFADTTFSLYLFLPAEGVSLQKVATHVRERSGVAFHENFYVMQGSLVMPKFTVQNELELKNMFAHFGVTDAFDSDRADFSGISQKTRGLYVSRIIQKNWFSVNEKGAEAASATAVQVTFKSAAPPKNEFDLVLDRPFLYFLLDKKTGIILFAGALTNPPQ